MQKRFRGFAVSWFFAPYVGSADLDFFKRIKDTPIDFDIVQVKREQADLRVLKHVTQARLNRFEVTTDHAQPRARKTRDEFSAAALQLFREKKSEYDFIISHSNEVPSHAVAWKCKQLAPHLPWIAYFGDPVSKNPYVKYIKEYPLNDEDIATEAETLKNANLIICNNEYQKRAMFTGELEQYADKAVVIPHCFEPGMYPRELKAAKPARRNARYTFLHLGTLYHVKRTATPLLHGVDRLIEVYPEYKHRFEVVFYGGPYYASDLKAQAAMRNRTHIRFEDAVPYLDSLKLMRDADALIIIDGIFDEKEDGLTYSPFFPGKMVDYMGAKKPILGITMPSGPTAEVLAASGNLQADNRADRIAYVLKRYIDGKVKPDTSVYDDFDCAMVAPMMEKAIRETIVEAQAQSPRRLKPRPAAPLGVGTVRLATPVESEAPALKNGSNGAKKLPATTQPIVARTRALFAAARRSVVSTKP